MPTRPCDFCLALQDDSVFADFIIDDAGNARLVRVSFDGYGCHKDLGGIGNFTQEDSQSLRTALESGDLNTAEIHSVLLGYFFQNRRYLWEDALKEYKLV